MISSAKLCGKDHAGIMTVVSCSRLMTEKHYMCVHIYEPTEKFCKYSCSVEFPPKDILATLVCRQEGSDWDLDTVLSRIHI